MEEKRDVSVDLSSVEKVDASFIQLLLAVQLESKKSGAGFLVNGVSDTVAGFARDIFCDELLLSIRETVNESALDEVLVKTVGV